MSQCPNCKNPIGCSCSGGSQLTKASDGKQVCTKCLSKYEQFIALLRITKNQNNPLPSKSSIN